MENFVACKNVLLRQHRVGLFDSGRGAHSGALAVFVDRRLRYTTQIAYAPTVKQRVSWMCLSAEAPKVDQIGDLAGGELITSRRKRGSYGLTMCISHPAARERTRWSSEA